MKILIVLAILLSNVCFAYESTEQIYIGSQKYDGYTTWYIEPDLEDEIVVYPEPYTEDFLVIDGAIPTTKWYFKTDNAVFEYEGNEYNIKELIEHIINQIESLRATNL